MYCEQVGFSSQCDQLLERFQWEKNIFHSGIFYSSQPDGNDHATVVFLLYIHLTRLFCIYFSDVTADIDYYKEQFIALPTYKKGAYLDH